MTAFRYIGSVSHGTMCAEDLIPAFSDLLDSLKDDLITSSLKTFHETEECKRIVSRIDDTLATIERCVESEEYYDSGDADDDVNTLIDLLNEFAPDYLYFGSHPGDGADFGFWVSHEAIEDDVHDGELLRVSDLSEAEGHSGLVLLVNDHGNMTLYRRAGLCHEEIWSIV